ncbi:class II aldolase/adducin family protein [Streptomyces marispadix]|uniref:Class II aldolase/adducin family protein n=1 Tax=Streptomyces marispadix TaxID=2922868 RepID=A0ABS9T4T3_9ACTN|nr:class II aldolase/adducin family protein [Streptomyces marispadix]MCH6163526.1 class II aldolase/adducin family protein [Streptomyces marispadix]
MSALWKPEAVPGELVALTRRLGDPAADLVVLAEGNTSTRLADGTFAVKTSGARMDTAGADDFVVVDPGELTGVLRPFGQGRDAGGADRNGVSGGVPGGQDELTGALAVHGPYEGPPRRASVETLVHLAALEYADAAWVAHTHPTAVVGLLACAAAEELWSAPLFPDEAVVLGRPAWVPYAAPGLELGRAVAESLTRYREAEGVPPRLVLLGNHGIVALGQTPAEVEAVTAMCVKAARIRSIALAAGGLSPLDAGHAAALAGRGDEKERWTRLGSGR